MLKHILSRKIIEKFFIAATILAVALYPKFPLIVVPQTSVRIRLEDFLIFFMGVYVVSRYIRNLKSLLKNSLERSVVIFILIGLLSVISGILLTQTVVFHIGFLHWARRVEYFVPFFFALQLERKNIREYLEFTIKIMAITISLLFVYGLGQKYLSWPVIVTQNAEVAKGIALRFVPGAHLTSTFAGHYDLASFMVLTLPTIAATFFVVKGKLPKIIFFVIFILGLWLIANTLSRISIAAYLLAITVTMISIRQFKAYFVVIFISLLVFSFSTDLLDRYSSIIRVIKESTGKIMLVNPPIAQAGAPTLPGGSHLTKPSILAAFEDRSTSIRINVEWPRAIRAFTKNPLLGTGYSSITLATDNDYLRLLGEIGILGFGAFFLIVLRLFGYFWTLLKWSKQKTLETAFVAGIFGAFIGEMLNATFIDIFEASKFALIFWFLVGLFVILVRSVEKKNEKAI